MMRLGGVPIGVRTPPIEQAYAVISMSPVAYLYSCRSISRPFAANISLIDVKSPRQIGNIMAAVAVFDTHPEQSAAARPTARNIRLGLEPTHLRDSSQYANLLSSPCFIIAFARINPPMNRKIIGFANAAKACFTETTPTTTASVGPMSDVTGIGTGSVIHHKATSTMIARSLCPGIVNASIGVRKTRIARSGPPNNPIVRLFRSNACSALLTAKASLLILSMIIRPLFCMKCDK